MCSHCADFMCLLKLALLIFAVPEVPQVNSIVFSHSALTCISKAIGAPGTNTGLGTEGTRPPGPDSGFRSQLHREPAPWAAPSPAPQRFWCYHRTMGICTQNANLVYSETKQYCRG